MPITAVTRTRSWKPGCATMMNLAPLSSDCSARKSCSRSLHASLLCSSPWMLYASSIGRRDSSMCVNIVICVASIVAGANMVAGGMGGCAGGVRNVANRSEINNRMTAECKAWTL
ncbi:hypothetical protein AMAG_17952 [Allomyces macrogynus ATCC 38327]|uniref:Uncharacterized protein n=1 Tax=Allomyces macrogynus (strain ATCC 38327) TaxID=578462 RepID=A0A0L0S265_ALLM3|nr:hypothetical protein AMAG_17952 [Allomyces macrogynus ATCC 38327]|eukprot:KNE56682.1 hypothetical protein AMAG_17952 [Allomyces macrogynus ATCC 38327]